MPSYNRSSIQSTEEIALPAPKPVDGRRTQEIVAVSQSNGRFHFVTLDLETSTLTMHNGRQGRLEIAGGAVSQLRKIWLEYLAESERLGREP